MKIDQHKSIEQLENDFWKDSNFESFLVEKCHRYRKIPLQNLSVEQMRLLIGQNIGLSFLMPKAFDILSKNILVEGDFYPGDLLKNVRTADTNFWSDNKELKKQFKQMISENLLQIEMDKDNNNKQLLKIIRAFLSDEV